jgi:hypothetical protein
MALNASGAYLSPWFDAHGSQAQSIHKSLKLTSFDFSIDKVPTAFSSHLQNRGVIFSLKLEDMKRGSRRELPRQALHSRLNCEQSDSMIVTRR